MNKFYQKSYHKSHLILDGELHQILLQLTIRNSPLLFVSIITISLISPPNTIIIPFITTIGFKIRYNFTLIFHLFNFIFLSPSLLFVTYMTPLYLNQAVITPNSYFALSLAAYTTSNIYSLHHGHIMIYKLNNINNSLKFNMFTHCHVINYR